MGYKDKNGNMKIEVRKGNYMQNIYYDPNTQKEKNTRRWFQNVKLVGELDEGTSIYIEDYAYTYLSQYANSDLYAERSAVLIGKYDKQSDQMIISGILPIKLDLLDGDTKWLSKEILEAIKEEKENYFPQGEYIGWMHTQPGYGVMTTPQEVAVHQEVFEDMGVLLLVDPIHDVKTFFEYKNQDFIRRDSYCVYYEKNEAMQHYMMEYPINEQERSAENDQAVTNFREMGARRKREVMRKRKTSTTLKAVVGTLLLTGAFVMGIYKQQKKINTLEKDVVNMNRQYSEMTYGHKESPVEVVFTSSKQEIKDDLQDQIQEPEKIEAKIEAKIEEETEATEVTPKETTQVEKQVPLAEAPKEYDVHLVKNGESLLNISYKHYRTGKMVREIAKLNKIDDLDAIYIGQKLKLPVVR